MLEMSYRAPTLWTLRRRRCVDLEQRAADAPRTCEEWTLGGADLPLDPRGSGTPTREPLGSLT